MFVTVKKQKRARRVYVDIYFIRRHEYLHAVHLEQVHCARLFIVIARNIPLFMGFRVAKLLIQM